MFTLEADRILALIDEALRILGSLLLWDGVLISCHTGKAIRYSCQMKVGFTYFLRISLVLA